MRHDHDCTCDQCRFEILQKPRAMTYTKEFEDLVMEAFKASDRQHLFVRCKDEALLDSHALLSAFAKLVREEAKQRRNVLESEELNLGQAFNALVERFGLIQEAKTETPCRIHEYDGAFKCYAHNRMWGAVPDPQEPCAGWVRPGA